MSVIKIACIGEAMVELSLDRAQADIAHLGVAGDTLNTAIYLKRAAPEMQVSYVTRLGRDAFSDRILRFIQGEGLDVSRIGFSADRTPGLYAISTDGAGERSFAYWRDRSAARELFGGAALAPALVDLNGFDVVYLSAITLAILSGEARGRLLLWLDEYRQKGGKVAFDSNYRPQLWEDVETARRAISAMWRRTDIALPSVDDEQLVFGDVDAAAVVARLMSCGVRDGALKRGAAGPLSFGADVQGGFAAATHVVDSTAAGDSFNAGFLAAYLRGADQLDCLHAGHDLAVRVVGVKGAIIPKT